MIDFGGLPGLCGRALSLAKIAAFSAESAGRRVLRMGAAELLHRPKATWRKQAYGEA